VANKMPNKKKWELNIDNDIQAMLFIVKPDKYQDFVKEFSKNNFKKNVSCYVTLTRPFKSLVGFLEKIKIDTDSIFFIDTSTKMTGSKDLNADNCLFIESPSALTSLSISVNKVTDASEPKYILFDSLSSLLIYNPEQMIIKFSKDLINKIRISKSKIIFICLDGKDEANMIEKISMFVDKINRIE
jgi:hypothetical protein